ncbi:MAG: PhzF family phenazine biosynthesis protein [Planctomycetota bacterium]|jgi:PhzF family phenazine biosynthesis protein
MGERLFVVDAFTSKPFAGNPAAVCLLRGEREDAWMQSVAAEMNLSETAFLLERGDGFSLRWFTPETEVDLCGHATLAGAHVLFEEGLADAAAGARFQTASGPLAAARAGEEIELDFPALPAEACELPADLLGALGARGEAAVWSGRSRFDYLVELESAEAVRALRPDFPRLREADVRGTIVTARSDRPDVDFISRFFAPHEGVDEDPVTGSAHCVLGPYWGERLGKTELVGFQASKRGGTVRVGLRGERVTLAGRAVTVSRGELLA